MGKEGILVAVLFLISVFAVAGVFASVESDNVQKAYTCLNKKIDAANCSKMNNEEKIFSLLSVGKCKTELLASSKNGTCWPDPDCNLETTSKAIIALNKVGVNTSLPVEWVLSKKGLSKDLNWYLEVDSNRAISCSAGYRVDPNSSASYGDYEFNIGENKIINQSAGPCLERANSNFWFAISPNCYESEFQISCNESFVSTLLYQEKSSGTYHVSENVHSSYKGVTLEKINSYCFLSGESCDYLGTSWAATALDYLGKNVSSFFPYLTTLSTNYQSAFPEVFLYFLTGRLEYKTSILNKQVLNTYFWVRGGIGKYYDTALALLPFQNKDFTEKDNAKKWLFNIQQDDGCWDKGNIVTNGFLLFSIWPKGVGSGGNGGDGETLCSDVGYTCVNDSSQCSSGTVKQQYLCETSSEICCDNSSSGEGGNDCESAGYTCALTSSCQGAPLYQYNDCPGVQRCCETLKEQKTCEDINGTVCSSNEVCSGGNSLYTAGLGTGEECCVGSGTCEEVKSPVSTCEDNLGYCSSSCSSGDVETTDYTCDNSANVCCMPSENPPESGSYWWIWVLFFLVVLVVVGIMYRNKLREFIQKLKAKKGSSNGRGVVGRGGIPPRFPPGYSRNPRIGAPAIRKMIPSQTPQRFIPRKKSSKELDEILRKLKEIGK